MQYELVDSRLDIPPAPPRHVPRPCLCAALDTAKDVPLVLLSAGPGTGKTVLLAEWARSTRLRVAWTRPAPEDDDPARFGALVTSALRIPADPRPAGLVPPQGRPVDFVHLAVEVLGMMAYVDRFLGRPRHADDAALQAHRLLRGQPGLRTPLSLRLAAAVRSVQRADFAAAARHLRHASPPVAVSADPGLAAACALWQATVLAHSGSPQEAKATVEAAAGPPLPLLDVHRDVILSGLETRLGRPEAALRRLAPHRDGRFAALADVASARSCLAFDDVSGARQCIQRVLTSGTSRAGRDVLVEAMLLGARIAELEHDTGRALEMITHALDVAQAELVLPFAAAMEAFGCLLARHPGIASRWPAPPGGTAIDDSARQERAVPHRPVMLTDREQSVLAYLATSLAAAEIAEELYLSVNTVKTHLAAIYRKLGASGRREAVRRARELELLLAPQGWFTLFG